MTNERRNITQPSDWWAAFERQAEAEGISLSEWIGKQCEESLPAKQRKALSERITRGRPKQSE